jgi:hypothetical protein
VLGEIRSTGADADGELGDPDPLDAIQEVLPTRSSSPPCPPEFRKWLRMEVPSRVERRFALPVTMIISAV